MRGTKAEHQSEQLPHQTGGGLQRAKRPPQSKGLDQVGGRAEESGYWHRSAGLQIWKKFGGIFLFKGIFLYTGVNGEDGAGIPTTEPSVF